MKAVYKIGTALLALAIFPVLILLPFIKIIVVSDVASFFSSSPMILLDDSYSLKELYELYVKHKDSFASSGFTLDSLPETVVDALKVPAITFLVFFALAVICAVAVFFVGLIAKNKRWAMIISALGAGSSFGMNLAFNNISKPLVNGSISVMDLLGSDLSATLSNGLSEVSNALMSLFGSGSELIDIRLFSLSSAYLFMLLLFLAIIMWSVGFTLAEWDNK